MAVVGVVGLLAVLSLRQVDVWKNNESLYRHAIEAQPFDSFGYANLGTLYEKAGDNETARDYYAKVVAMKKSDYISWFNLGVVHGKLGEVVEAEEAYGKALLVYPQHPPSLLNLSILKLKQASSQEEVEEIEKLLLRAVATARLQQELFLNSLVDVQLRLKKYEEAAANLSLALELHHQNPALAAELQRKAAWLRQNGWMP